MKKNQVYVPTVMLNVDVPNIAANEVINIVPGEGQLSVSFISEPDWEALAFVKNFYIGENHFNTERKVRIAPSGYVHARLKCSDSGFDCNGTRTHNHLIRKRTLNHLAKLTK